ncbi:hypothetical protein F8388_005796 [Cannabis sativa]|uniref:Ubiquitin-like protease family profile domain-containing protein n=1 Tax=Cannabis sativa TaxID=3483 RepID=A0A7J6HMM0_CANSA|nr:hypothetical protein F8388_005796 [Cannabis sativa]
MIDKKWIFQENRLSVEYFNGLKNFLKLSSFHLNDENKIRCPCVSCMNLYYYDLETIERHIFVRGFYTKYVLWEFHGEDITEIHEDEENAESIVEEDNTLYDKCDDGVFSDIPINHNDDTEEEPFTVMSNKKSRDLPLSRTRSFGPKKTHNNDSTSTKSPPPVPCSPNEDSTTPSDDEIQELKGELRVYGPNATIFGNTVGVKVRHHAPLQYSGWAKIPPEDKKAVYARIMDIFDIDFKKDPYLETICNHYCQERYRGYRNKCHSKYKSLIEEGKNPLENRPKKLVLTDEDWEWMCKNCFSNEEWKKSKQSIGDEVQQQTMKCGEIEMFRKTHYTIENGWINEIAKEKYNEMVELRRDKLIQFEDGLLLVVDEAAIYRQVLGEGNYGWLRGLGPTPGKKISVELSSKHKEIEEERLDKLEKIIEDLRKDQDNNVARIVQENMKIFYESQQGRLLEERSSESPIRIPSMDKQNSFFTQLEPSKEKDQPSSSQKPTKSILHEKLVKANRAQYFRFFHPILALDSCQAQNAMTMADRMEGTEAGQFWLLSVNTGDHWMLAIIDVLRETCYWLDSIGLPPPNKIKSLMAMTFDYYNASSNRQPKKSGITWKSIKCPQQISDFECGYYLMRYMREFCMNSRPINWLTTQWNGKKTYTKQEIDEILLEWADQFLEEITEDGVL